MSAITPNEFAWLLTLSRNCHDRFGCTEEGKAPPSQQGSQRRAGFRFRRDRTAAVISVLLGLDSPEPSRRDGENQQRTGEQYQTARLRNASWS